MKTGIEVQYIARDSDADSYPSMNAKGIAWLEVVDGTLVLAFTPYDPQDWPPEDEFFEFYSVGVEDLEPTHN